MGEKSNISWTNSSWNPVTGCSKVSPGCEYCLAPETPILYADMTWRPIGVVQPGDVLFGFDEFAATGGQRKYLPSIVEHVSWSTKESQRLITEKSEVITTAEHRWLRHHSRHWPRTQRLRVGASLRQIGLTETPDVSNDYRVGYLSGITLGDGTCRYSPGQGTDRQGFPQAYWRVALKSEDEAALGRIVAYLAAMGVHAETRPFDSGTIGCQMQKVEIRSLPRLDVLHPMLTVELPTDDYRRGFIAGFFDAEGSCSDNLRVSQNDVAVLERFRTYAARLGFVFDIERYESPHPTARLRGTLLDRMRFFQTCNPALIRKHGLYGLRMQAIADPIEAVESVGLRDVVDIQTSTHTFYAAWLAAKRLTGDGL